MRDRLSKLLSVKRIKEKQSMQALARAQQATSVAQKNFDDLCEMSSDYREKHLSVPQISPLMLKQFRQFYNQLAQAKTVQQAQVEQAQMAEQTVRDYLTTHIYERRGVEKVVRKRDQQHRTAQKRKARRTQSSTPKSFV